MLAATTRIISCCNFTFLRSKPPKSILSAQYSETQKNPFLRTSISSISVPSCRRRISISPHYRRVCLQIRRSSLNTRNSQYPLLEEEEEEEAALGDDDVGRNGNSGGGGGDGDGGEERDWTTSILLLGLWIGLMYYVFNLAPNQTPSMDKYLLEKLLKLKGDDGFMMNEVLVSLWYIMGLWPLVYTMLLLPTGRSSKGSLPAWPFLVFSCFGGAYALLPYFVLWNPPPPPIEENELRRWPLNFLESKLTAGVAFAAGLGLLVYAGLANGDIWKEFYQYFRESKFIHLTTIDFTLLTAFAPFWVYNDMTARKWSDKGSWLLPLSLMPFIGPALYLLLRPSLSPMPINPLSPTTTEKQ